MLSFHFGNFPTRKTFLITLMTLNTPSPDLPTTPPHHQLYTLCHHHSPILLNHTSLPSTLWVGISQISPSRLQQPPSTSTSSIPSPCSFHFWPCSKSTLSTVFSSVLDRTPALHRKSHCCTPQHPASFP